MPTLNRSAIRAQAKLKNKYFNANYAPKIAKTLAQSNNLNNFRLGFLNAQATEVYLTARKSSPAHNNQDLRST